MAVNTPDSFTAGHDVQPVYLVLRDDLQWRNVFSLVPGQVTTVGRAPTNRVVVPDDICSRRHCEIFQAGTQWILRDLGSRNGTLIAGHRVFGERPLLEGDEIQIGEFFLVFTHDISQPSPEELSLSNTDTFDGEQLKKMRKQMDSDGTEILHRQQQTRYRTSEESGIARDRITQELASLYRLALEMGSAQDVTRLAEVVLDGLFNRVQVDIGAILLLPRQQRDPQSEHLRIASYRSRSDASYEKVSHSLSGIVLSSGEAILARDVRGDSRLVNTTSLEQIQARSVICAPIRSANGVFGLVHLYTTHGGRLLNVEDLDFTLAVADQCASALENLYQATTLRDGLNKARDEAQSLRRQLAQQSDLIGDSDVMCGLKDQITRIAPTDATVLIRGESGVGKELVARAIHFGSERNTGPFVCMNCAALSETLLESELFGHEKGSFTGAAGRKIGKFEQAHRGTLFLDEVGEMSLAIQSKFLRVLEGHPFERVGGSVPINVDVRVVAATNRDLEQAIKEKSFRQDLFFRLFVVEIAVPALRERRDDIPLLARYFVNRLATRASCRVESISDAALNKLTSYHWPGNVRELQNTIERAVILCRGSVLEPADIQLSTNTTSVAATIPTIKAAEESDQPARDVSLEQLEREHILATLERSNWNKSMASQILGIERSTLDRKLKRYKVKRPDR